MAAPILPALRTATGEAHQRLEDAVAIESCLADSARYRRLLEVFLGFYRPLEPRVFEALGPRADALNLTGRHKTPWLEADLQALGVSAVDLRTLPDCGDLPPSAAASTAFGCLYVLEGATLGGRHISAMMARSAVPPEARRFFGGYGEQTGERWQEFIAALEGYAAGSGNAEGGEIIRGASETFACLHRWFVRQYPAHDFPG